MKSNNSKLTKTFLLALSIVLFSGFSFAQSQSNFNSTISPDHDIVYRLFPTTNMWNFIKLNTRDGRLWQVQYSTETDQLEVPLSSFPRVSKEDEKNGRFFLYPTQNMWTFILVDQIDGRVWQVQWSTEAKNRFVIPIK